ncbi:MAG TPA: TonB-dependent receptor [Ignavibacteriaceae bacterium]|nr:TonB-dependent receptor [Ignavibacteriaceae bacterium]
MRKLLLLSTLVLQIFFIQTFAQVGKINGVVRDANTGEALIGANVLLEGTTIGAATNVDGYYSITNVPPGTYNLKASMVGYAPQVITNVRVNIDLTTDINISLRSSAFETEEVVVVATQPIVKQDVSASVVNLNIKEIENLPVANVSSVIGLQAGVQGLTIRGGASDQTAFVVNGITLRDARNNTPYTGISLTSVGDMQIQTGGFNAEYGDIRSGLINVVTKEGSKSNYSFAIISRYSPWERKNFGDPFNSPNSYWIRPYIDDAVCWTGTDTPWDPANGLGWDPYTLRQYQEFKGGWNSVSQKLLADNDPNNDLTPQAAQQVFLWQHRKVMDVKRPDFDIDMTLSGPVPYGEHLGNLRFAASYRRSQTMYLIPLSTDAYRDYNAQIKVTSDIAEGMKLTLEGLLGRQTGTNSSRSGGPGLFSSAAGIANQLDFRSGLSYLDTEIFSYDYWAPSQITTDMEGFKFTHVLSPKTFYEITGSRVATDYKTAPGRYRDTQTLYYFGGVGYNEAPFGNFSGTGGGIGSAMNLGLGWSNSRDSSKLAVYTLKGNYASQVDKYNYVKSGFEFIYTDNNVNYALVEPSLPTNNSQSKWHTFPLKFAAYAQDKLEFEGMIANIGLRLDYSDPGGEWYVFDQYNAALSGQYASQINSLLPKEKTKKQLNLSPRLGVAFPITVNSKLYFNYGHFRSIPLPDDLFLLRQSQAFFNITRIANPNNPLPLTVAYELGYEQNLFDQFLLSIKGYYKDVKDQTISVHYVSRNGTVDYYQPEPISYADIRGFELEFRKNRGEWITGFVNYTYMVSSSGYFGYTFAYQDPLVQAQREVTYKSDIQQNKPIPQPYARANIDIFTPDNWGPEIGGAKILDQIRLSILGSWSSGNHFTWTGGGAVKSGFLNNFQWRDAFNVDLRISKTIYLGPVNVELFADIYNALNIKYMSYYRAGFRNQDDYDKYMQSLHLPADKVKDFNSYGNIPGNDTPGDYRDPSVSYQPLEYANNIQSVTSPNTVAYYYDAATGSYYQWSGQSWSYVRSSVIEDVLNKKAYIDMPNLSYMTFLGPRNVFFGIKLNVNL